MARVVRPPGPLPRAESKARAVRAMFDSIASRYDLMNRILTFGMDMGWRRRAVAALGLPRGALVLDVACGTGDFCRLLAEAGHRAIGVDFAAGMLAAARTRAPLVRADALKLPVAGGAVDGITCGFALRNFAGLEDALGEMARALRPGGRVALLEVSEPPGALLRAGHSLYFNRIVPLVGGLLSDRRAYGYLPRSVAYLPRRSELVEMMRRAGLAGARRVPLSGGIAQILVGTRA
ncbi:MAG: ubiquinone/menaquinone biosynthesis methyltransferase [Acidobacteria bacterium]|nr:ubiquinone/menaquinone biosynthesis methyltransferase [Acidobacteriota bacterium]